jgi:MFS family permease
MSEKSPLNAASLRRNVRIIYALAFFHMFMLIVPVIVPFFESKGLSLSEIFYLQAVYAGIIVLLEAPSGWLADRFGRRTVLLIGSAAHGAGYLWLVFADSFVQLMVFEFLLGIAASMMSGADLAILYDTEKALSDSEDSHTGSIAHLSSTKAFAEGAGALAGGALALGSFDLMVLAQAGVSWVCLVLALLLVEPPYRETAGSKPLRGFKAIYIHLMKGDKVLRQTFLAIPLYNLCTFHVAWLVQPYWEEQGLSLLVFGALWFAQSLTVGVASQCGHYLEKTKGPVFALFLIGLLPIVGHFGMAWLQGWMGIAVCFILFFCRGLYQVIMVNALNRRVPGNVRATVNSLTSLTFRFGFILTGPLIGRVAETQGLHTALSVLGVASIVIFLLIMLPLIKTVKVLQQAKLAAA